jgi:hypothetical protein
MCYVVEDTGIRTAIFYIFHLKWSIFRGQEKAGQFFIIFGIDKLFENFQTFALFLLCSC